MPIRKPPLIKKCFHCQQEVIVKFCPPLKTYVNKNNWNYWTEQTNAPEKYICSSCLRNMYYRDYLSLCEQISGKKRSILKVYVSMNSL